MTNTFEPTNELRWAPREVWGKCERVLQQRWRKLRGTNFFQRQLSLNDFDYEWRDVPTIKQES